MCGITGILGNADLSISNSMAACLSHRGPDGYGGYVDEVGNAGVSLSQSRLAIVDIDGSWQPIKSDHGCVLVQNGETKDDFRI